MNKIYCSNCGRLIPEDSNFCRYCGAAQHGPAASVYQAQAPTLNHSLASFAIAQTQKHGRGSEKGKSRAEPQYIRKRHLCSRVKWSFVIAYLGTTAIILLLFLIGAFIYPWHFLAVMIGYLLVLYIFASIVYGSFYYSVDETGFQKEYGIIHKRFVTIPYSQIQNVNITRSLTDRFLGLAKISIETAGSPTHEKIDVAGGSQSQAEGHLPGLTLPEAKRVHDLLLERSNAHNKSA